MNRSLSTSMNRRIKTLAACVAATLSPCLILIAVRHWTRVNEIPLLLLIGCVVVNAFYGGLLPGLISAFTGAFLTAYFLIEPVYTLRVDSVIDFVRLATFVSVALIVSVIDQKRRSAEADLRRSQEDLQMSWRREQELARSDFLTGLANRRAFHEFIDFESRRMERHGRPLTLAYVDLDNFKLVNDRHGHDAGDLLLQRAALLLQKMCRQSDIVARIGGDEFALLFPETSSADAHIVLDKVHAALEAGMKENGWPVTASIGAVTFLACPKSGEELLKRADETMFQAKHAGKNIVIYSLYEPPLGH